MRSASCNLDDIGYSLRATYMTPQAYLKLAYSAGTLVDGEAPRNNARIDHTHKHPQVAMIVKRPS